jgi:hypothetical protein
MKNRVVVNLCLRTIGKELAKVTLAKIALADVILAEVTYTMLTFCGLV